MSRAVVKMLKKIVDMSNANLLKNADGLLSKKVSMSVQNGQEKNKSGYLKTDAKCPIGFFQSAKKDETFT